MPRFGEAHDLLSARHPDTSPPAAGADPSDGQVPRWSDALGAWSAQDLPAGVTDHGLLTGLYPDDDHAQYALADKSRPSPWVAAADLSPRSLADLGTKAHDLLAGLGDDDHSIYALLAGRSGGQSFIGGAAASEHLTLQSTAHATRGYVRAQDDLQLLSNIIRDSGGNARITLAATSPEVALTGDLDVSKHVGIGSAGSPIAGVGVRVDTSVAESAAAAISAIVHGTRSNGVQFTYGLLGGAYAEGTPANALCYGLYFLARHNTASGCGGAVGAYLKVESGVGGSGALTQSKGLHIATAGWSGSKPATSYGMHIQNQGNAAVTTAYGILLDDQVATTVRLLELGPAVPYLRLLGGGDPAAGDTNLFLKVGSTLMQVYAQSNYLRVK